MYNGLKNKIEWKCKNGHIQKSNPWWFTKQVKTSHCITCNKKQKLNMSDMHEIALQRGGQCLSTEYITAVFLKMGQLSF